MTNTSLSDVQMTKINALVLFSHHYALTLWVRLCTNPLGSCIVQIKKIAGRVH